MRRIGLIADTHGHLDARVASAFEDVDAILHAGDICAPGVLWELESLGVPVTAVAGNCDRWESPAVHLPHAARLTLGGVRILVVHERADARAACLEAVEAVDVVVFGHSHMPVVEHSDGRLWVNPGSAWQARSSKIGRSVGILDVEDGRVADVRIIALDDHAAAV